MQRQSAPLLFPKAAILLVPAAVAHLAAGEPRRAIAGVGGLLGLLAASYALYHRRWAIGAAA